MTDEPRGAAIARRHSVARPAMRASLRGWRVDPPPTRWFSDLIIGDVSHLRRYGDRLLGCWISMRAMRLGCAAIPRTMGLFFIAVKTTRIYCRPVCGARQPLTKNICFYPSAAAAERGGLSPLSAMSARDGPVLPRLEGDEDYGGARAEADRARSAGRGWRGAARRPARHWVTPPVAAVRQAPRGIAAAGRQDPADPARKAPIGRNRIVDDRCCLPVRVSQRAADDGRVLGALWPATLGDTEANEAEGRDEKTQRAEGRRPA